MKKKHYVYLAFITFTALIISPQSRDKDQNFIDILLMNIECLSTPESPRVDCWHYGSVDCPGTNIKVLYYM